MRPIPQTMTYGKEAPRVHAVEPKIVRGPSLTREMVGWLEDALAGWRREERLDQLEQLDARLARTYRRYERGLDAGAIAWLEGCSASTAYELIAAALRYMHGDRSDDGASDGEAKLLALAAVDRAAFDVYQLWWHGWSQAAVCDLTGMSLRTVQRKLAKAKRVAGDLDGRTMRRFAALALRAGAVSVTDREALEKENVARSRPIPPPPPGVRRRVLCCEVCRSQDGLVSYRGDPVARTLVARCASCRDVP